MHLEIYPIKVKLLIQHTILFIEQRIGCTALLTLRERKERLRERYDKQIYMTTKKSPFESCNNFKTDISSKTKAETSAFLVLPHAIAGISISFHKGIKASIDIHNKETKTEEKIKKFSRRNTPYGIT